MKIYGLLGKNIGYSLSPAMQNAAFKALGMDAKYELFDISEGALDNFFVKLKKGALSGCNVTVPYKEKALGFVDDKSDAVRIIGALNTIVSLGNALKGYNTDYHGFMKSLRGSEAGDLGFEPEGKSIFVFGAGGAAKAVVYALLILNAKKIAIADVDNEKSERFAASIALKGEWNTLITVTHDEAQHDEFISRADLLVNATPCGSEENDSPLFDYKYIDKGLSVFDLIYARVTPLIKEARTRGAKAVGGVNMLLYQAAHSFELWTGRVAPLDVMRNALLEKVNSRQTQN